MSTKTRHSYVPFYTSDWLAGTARMPRMVKSVYFDICCYTWDTGRKVPDAELVLMLADTGPQGDQIVDALVKSGKLERDEERNVWSRRALAEAEKAFELWQKKSKGGKNRAASQSGERQDSSSPAPIEPDQEPEPDIIGKASPSLSPAGGDEGKPAASEKPRRITAGQCAEVFASWNRAAEPLGLKLATKMTGSREGAIRARIEELGMETIEQALSALPECDYVLAEAAKKANWTGLDWFLRPNTIPKINEGAYRTVSGKGSSAWRDME